MKIKTPNWNDYEAVEKLVNKILDTHDFAEDPLPPTRLPRPADRSDAEIAEAERLAVEAGWRGDGERLAKLIHPIAWVEGGQLRGMINPAVARLKASTWTLIGLLVEGDPVFSEPKKPRKRGGSKKMTLEEREEKYPVYKAALEARLIIEILNGLYSETSQKDIRDRACLIAADRNNIDTDLAEYMLRKGFFKRPSRPISKG